jgi:hypothetical protein
VAPATVPVGAPMTPTVAKGPAAPTGAATTPAAAKEPSAPVAGPARALTPNAEMGSPVEEWGCTAAMPAGAPATRARKVAAAWMVAMAATRSFGVTPATAEVMAMTSISRAVAMTKSSVDADQTGGGPRQ